jgi:hypothetical protein
MRGPPCGWRDGLARRPGSHDLAIVCSRTLASSPAPEGVPAYPPATELGAPSTPPLKRVELELFQAAGRLLREVRDLLPTHLAETHASVKREANEDTVRRVIGSLENAR